MKKNSKYKNTSFLSIKPRATMVVFITAIVLFFALALSFEYVFFNSKIQNKEDKLQTNILKYKTLTDNLVDDVFACNQIDDLFEQFFQYNKELALFIYEDDIFRFWNTNEFDLYGFSLDEFNAWQPIQLDNVEGECKIYTQGNIKVLAFIPVKFTYPYTNDYLKNGVLEHLRYDADYLYILSFLSYLVVALFLLFAYYFVVLHATKKELAFAVSSLILIAITALAYFFKIPKVFAFSYFFSEQQYAANQAFVYLLNTSFFALIGLFVLIVILRNNLFHKKYFLFKRIVFYLYILVFITILHNIVLKNNIDLWVASLKDFDLFTSWSWVIIFLLSTNLVLFVHLLKRDYDNSLQISSLVLIDIGFIILNCLIYNYLHPHFLSNFLLFQLIVLTYFYLKILLNKKTSWLNTAFVVLLVSYFIASSFMFSNHKKLVKYKLQAENILINGNSEEDPIAELLIEEFYKRIIADEVFEEMHSQRLDIDTISEYLNQQYMHLFWNKYELAVYAVDKNAEEYQDYINFLESTSQKVNSTEFYSLPTSLYTMSFVGLVDIVDKSHTSVNNNVYFIAFYPTKDFRSYSFPNLFANKESDVFRKTEVSIAQYDKGVLVYNDYHADWNVYADYFEQTSDGFQKIKIQGADYYALKSGDKQIIIKDLDTCSTSSLHLFSLFIILIFWMLMRLLLGLLPVNTSFQLRSIGFTAKFQIVAISLLIVGFIGTLLFSVNYIKENYEKEQIIHLENKKNYIRESLQEVFYWTEDLTYINSQNLHNSLHELAHRYQSDINIYDNRGVLVASSQALVFSQKLVSNLISPEFIFSNQEFDYQYENIGELSYLAAYTDLLNGEYLQIGYISIPQYLSQTELNQKIAGFISVIVQIYLIIIVLAIIALLLIGRKLAEPIRLLAIKMKSMRLDGKNEKVEYFSKDEIGQLVEQYNRTVDELEKNTQLLLAAERESAWRIMARQVAHEINNPLTPMKLTIQQLQRTKGMDTEQFDVNFDKTTELLIEQIDNLSRIATSFSQFAKLPETQFASFDIVQKLHLVIELFKDNNEHITINSHIEDEKLMVMGDAEQLTQVFTNILKNAIQSIPSNAKGKIDVLLSQAKGKIYIKFKDNGIGISADNQQNIFIPNFTTKSFGAGLGLSISKSIIENMGGNIYLESQEGEGTTFTIELISKIN